ncbi:MAG: ATP-binding protein, partial [Tangfeifania sp.]
AVAIKNEILLNWETEIFRSAVESDFLSIAIFSLEGELIFSNHLFTELFGKKPYKNLINPDLEKLRQLPVKENNFVFEGYLTIGDYSKLNTSLLAHVYRKNNQLLIVALEDPAGLQEQNTKLQQLNREINNLQRQLIKEKRNLEDALSELDETNRKLKIVNRQKDKFFSVIAHDLRSPFSSILGFAEILKDNLDDFTQEEIKKYTGLLHKSTNNTYRLLINLLDWSSVQRKKIKFTPEKTSISELTSKILNLFHDQAHQKDIRFKKQVPENLEWNIDRNMVTSILRNLISNAIKFSLRNSEITVSAEEKNNELKFSVSDYGIGMKPEKAKNLFKNDFNESERGTENEKGTGLGLSLAREFVDIHKGTIWAESEPEKGTTISFTIPANLPKSN